jgi:membrane protein YdbS with pleckstrin-like domain
LEFRAAIPMSGSMRKLLILIPLVLLLVAAVWFMVYSWNAIEGPPMPATGYVAMWLGIVFSVLVGCGLMALVFYSSRHGYDEAAHFEPADKSDA